jgi:hypothetical protein
LRTITNDAVLTPTGQAIHWGVDPGLCLVAVLEVPADAQDLPSFASKLLQWPKPELDDDREPESEEEEREEFIETDRNSFTFAPFSLSSIRRSARSRARLKFGSATPGAGYCPTAGLSTRQSGSGPTAKAGTSTHSGRRRRSYGFRLAARNAGSPRWSISGSCRRGKRRNSQSNSSAPGCTISSRLTSRSAASSPSESLNSPRASSSTWDSASDFEE